MNHHLNLPKLLLIMMSHLGRPTHNAPPLSLNSFKGHCVATVVAASLLLPAFPTSALSVSLVEDSATRLAFDIVWGESISPSPAIGPWPSGSEVRSGDVIPGVFPVLHVNVFSSFRYDVFSLDFGRSGVATRVFEIGDLVSFEGVQSLGLSGNPYGARFVYGSPFPPTGVPDNGASALLLSAGLAGLTLLRRTVVGLCIN